MDSVPGTRWILASHLSLSFQQEEAGASSWRDRRKVCSAVDEECWRDSGGIWTMESSLGRHTMIGMAGNFGSDAVL